MEWSGIILPSAERAVAPREIGVVQCRGGAPGAPVAPRARRRGPAVPRGLLLTSGPEIVFKLGGGVSAVCLQFKQNGAVSWLKT